MTYIVFVDRMTNDDVLSNVYSWSSKGDPANLFWVVEDRLDVEPRGLVSYWRLNQVDHDITSYAKHMKNYLMRLLPVLPAKEADSIRSNISAHYADVQKNFGEFSFYRGSSNDPNRMIIIKRKILKRLASILYFSISATASLRHLVSHVIMRHFGRIARCAAVFHQRLPMHLTPVPPSLCTTTPCW